MKSSSLQVIYKFNNIFASLRGKRGTEVKLEVKRRGFKDLLKFTVVRDKIAQ